MKRLAILASALLLPLQAGAAGISIQPYLDIRGQSAPSYAPDGTLSFLTTVTGTAQAWSVGPVSSYPVQLTYGTERAQFALWSPRISDGMLFGKDRGGNENTQFFLARADGANVRALTPNQDEVRHNFGAFSPDGRTIAYASNLRDRTYFDIYLMDVASGKERRVYQNNGDNSAIAFSHDGRKLLVQQSTSNFNNNIFVLDLQRGTQRLITKHSGNAVFECASFSADDRSALCISDKGREFRGRATIDVATSRVHFLDADKHDVDELAVSRDGRTEAFVTNVDGNGALRIADATTGNVTKYFTSSIASVPSGLAFDASGRHLAYTFSGAVAPPRVVEMDIASGAERARTRPSLAGLAPASFVEPNLVSWKSFDGRRISGWFYKARGATRFPVVIDIHGGPEAQTRPTFNAIDQYFVARGYAVLAPNVRGSTGFGREFLHLADVRKREDSVKDIHAAVVWLTTKSSADPGRIALYGGSYGGYMVLAGLTLFPNDFAAGVDIVGIGNWVTFLQNTSSYRRANREATYGSLETDRDFLASISPLAHVDRMKAPLMIFMGKNDPRVPAAEGQQMADALKARDVPVDLTIFPDEGHGIGRYANRITAYGKIADFLDKYIGSGSRTP